MRCAYPVMVQDKATGGVMSVPCGRCISCRTIRAASWTVRIVHEAREWDEKIFCTLTYDDKYLPSGGSLKKRELQLFLKRLRKNLAPRLIKYFAVGEYGSEKRRPHYHLILFGVGVDDARTIELCWPYGFSSVGFFSDNRAGYCAGYVVKKFSDLRTKDWYWLKGIEPEFMVCSRGGRDATGGIGSRYINSHFDKLRRDGLVKLGGTIRALPRYYKDKIYTEEDKILLHALAQEFYDEQLEKMCQKSGGLCDHSLVPYMVAENLQNEKNIEAKIKRRKL